MGVMQRIIKDNKFKKVFKTVDGGVDFQHSMMNGLITLNVPQSFKYGSLRDFYKRAQNESLISLVEPHTTTLMYKMGLPIYYSKGNQLNIKITT